MTALLVIGALLTIEIILFLIVNFLRSKFPWLITSKDDYPYFDKEALNKFISTSFDPSLGWVRKANTSGIENGTNGQITFHIDTNGSRVNALSNTTPIVAVFGDSYAFCRQVADNETWEVKLSKLEKFGVLNYGVGNYGLDQALLRYEQTDLPASVRVVIMNFVPETICRIQSYWKHYLEFGNIFAFKPRFVLSSTCELSLLQNPMNCIEDYYNYMEKLPSIRNGDKFYLSKFKDYQFRFPYILSFLRNPISNFSLISGIFLKEAENFFCKNRHSFENLPFSIIMKRNLIAAHREYQDVKATSLLSEILNRFNIEAKRRGHIPLVVVTPQLFDLKINNTKYFPYSKFYSEINSKIALIDLTNDFLSRDFESLYINDQYGGHLSPIGNQLVAERISSWLRHNSQIDRIVKCE